MFRVELETMALDSPNMYPSTLEEIKAETEGDPTLSVLCGFVAHGWPSDKSQVPTALRHYYPLRDQLAVYHGVLYKSHKVLIPVKLQSTMLKKLHHGHQDGESVIRRRAREVIGSLSTRVFETRTATGSEQFSLLTSPRTTTFTLLSIFK